MNDRSYIQNAGIHNSVEFYPQVALKQSISYQHPVTTSHITKISKSRRYHSFQSHCSSKNIPRRTSVIHVTVRTPKNSICPMDHGLSDYNSRLQINTAAIQAACQNRKASIKFNLGQNSVELPPSISYPANNARTDQNHRSLTQFTDNTLKNDLHNEHSKKQKICSSRINNKTNIHEEYYRRKSTTNSTFSSRLPIATSNTDISSSNFGELGDFHEIEKKFAQFSRRKLTNEHNQKTKRKRRRTKCLGGYCCSCSPLCTLLSLITALLIAAAIAALIIALIKSKPSTTSAVTRTVNSTTTSSTSTTSSATSSSTSRTSTSSTSTTSSATSSSTSRTSTSSTSSTTISSTSTTSSATTSSTTTSVTTATITSTSSTTTTPRPMCSITQTGDPIEGLYSTVAGGPTVGFEGRYSPYSETPDKAIDSDVTTKYLNYGTTSVMNANMSQPGANTGFYVTPTISNATVANGILFATGGDYPDRDPLTITLEGTNSTALNASSSWTLIYTGPSGIDPIIAPNRSTYGVVQIFPNTAAYRSYRLLMLSQRGYQDSIQYSESHIMTYC